MAGVRFLAVDKAFSLFHTIQTGSRDHSTSYPAGIEGIFAEDREAGA
jgi:hypothetical protein